MTPLEDTDPASIGPFTLRARLGAGGMGQVYFGESPAGQLVALKVIGADLGDDDARKRFAHEVESMQKVYGPNVAGLIDADPHADVPWLAMAYVAGRSLHQQVAHRGVLPVELVASLGALLVEGMRVIHKVGLLHRDLKPANVMLAADGPKIIDFGLATLARHKVRLTNTGALVGTPICMAPEQLAESDELGTPMDVYALGVCLLFAAAAKFPYDADTQMALLYKIGQADVPPDLGGAPLGLRPLLAAMLAHDPADRPTLDRVAEELLRIVADAGLSANQARVRLVTLTSKGVVEPDQSFPPAPVAPEEAAEPGSADGQASESADTPEPGWPGQATLPLDELSDPQATLPFSGGQGGSAGGEPPPTFVEPTAPLTAPTTPDERPRARQPKRRAQSAAGARRVAERLRAAYARDASL
ncbi:serine/threonine protein kinase [Murinocardiopsis flavida]|uniref:Serine/threonine protein kinase n=1 Tax=Murinocardiopsis flavida TaxID=645275 RepID=A0A2P8DEQ7_9ACTN|nr:serine/threonine-protein kinase [Murinocardiopsis flavida]PSK95716.1 serine/threonine protein kinase [Murinocardiopsis flavida]